VSLPPEIKIEKKQLTIRVFRAKHLVPMDSVSKKSDPYILFNFGDQVIRTEYRSNTLSPGSRL
jgi:Ca2+-dependent lipid-binding protein